MHYFYFISECIVCTEPVIRMITSWFMFQRHLDRRNSDSENSIFGSENGPMASDFTRHYSMRLVAQDVRIFVHFNLQIDALRTQISTDKQSFPNSSRHQDDHLSGHVSEALGLLRQRQQELSPGSEKDAMASNFTRHFREAQDVWIFVPFRLRSSQHGKEWMEQQRKLSSSSSSPLPSNGNEQHLLQAWWNSSSVERSIEAIGEENDGTEKKSIISYNPKLIFSADHLHHCCSTSSRPPPARRSSLPLLQGQHGEMIPPPLLLPPLVLKQ